MRSTLHMFVKPRGSNWTPAGKSPAAPRFGGASRKGTLADLPDMLTAAGREHVVVRKADPEKAEARGAPDVGTKANMTGFTLVERKAGWKRSGEKGAKRASTG